MARGGVLTRGKAAVGQDPPYAIGMHFRGDAAYGHFGRKPHEVSYVDAAGKTVKATAFSWERTDRAEALRADSGLK